MISWCNMWHIVLCLRLYSPHFNLVRTKWFLSCPDTNKHRIRRGSIFYFTTVYSWKREAFKDVLATYTHCLSLLQPLERGFCLKWICLFLITGNSIALLPPICNCLTSVDSLPETHQQSQAGIDWRGREMKLGRLHRYRTCQFLF